MSSLDNHLPLLEELGNLEKELHKAETGLTGNGWRR